MHEILPARVLRCGSLMLAALVVMPLPSALAAGRKPAPAPLARSALPAGFVVGNGVPSLSLKIDVAGNTVVSSSPVAGSEPGNLRATRSGDDAQTMLTVSSDLPVAIKFDLYVSTDGEQFTYASTCGVTPGISSFEMWKMPVHSFALGNPRVLPAGRMVCD